MKISSNILGDIGRSLKLSSPSPQENQIDIPPAVMLAMQPIAATETAFVLSPGTSSVVMNSSWSGSTLGSTNNNGPLTFLGSFCSAGVWDVSWQAQYFCNFASVAGDSIVGFRNGGTDKFIALAVFFSGLANTEHITQGRSLLSFSEPFQPCMIVAPSGAAQQTIVTFSWVAGKVIL